MLFRICYNFIYLSINMSACMCIEYMIQYRFSLLELLKKQFSLVYFLYI